MKGIRHLFQPHSVAVIGASAQDGSLGNFVMANLHGGNFKGPVLPVHPRYQSVHRVLCYRSVEDLPIVPELAILCTPPRVTPDLVAALGARGTRAAIVMTADPEGRYPDTAFKAALAGAARPHDLRMLGPGSMGVQVPWLGLNASWMRTWPGQGNLALVSQSGSVAASVVEWARRHGIGFSHVATTGDSADVDIRDLLDYFGGDMRTRAILLYVRSVRDGQAFLSAARAVARIKPVIVIKPKDLVAPPAGGDPVVASDAVYDAAFHRSGMLRVGDTGEWFDAVESLGYGKRHRCESLAIVGNGGDLGQLAAVPLAAEGKLAELHPDTVTALTGVVPSRLAVGNPVDLGQDADPQRYAKALEALFADPERPAVLAIYAPSLLAPGAAVAQAVAEAAKRDSRQVIACWMGQDDEQVRKLFGEVAVPLYDTPEKAARAFLHLVNYRLNQQALMELPSARGFGRRAEEGAGTDGLRLRDEEETPEILRAYGSIVRAVIDERPMLDEAESLAVLRAYGFDALDTRVAAGCEAAVAAAQKLGLPVEIGVAAASVAGDGLSPRRRADVIEEVRAAAEALSALHARPGAAPVPLVIQRAAPELRLLPLSLTVANDHAFGRVIMLAGAGRSAVMLPPLNLVLCEAEVGVILEALRSTTGLAVEARTVQDLLVRLSDLLVALPELVSFHSPSLRIGDGGIVFDDARLGVAAHELGKPHLAIRPYPHQLEVRIALKTGRPVLVRPLRPEDDGLYRDMLLHVAPHDLFLRFCSRFGGEANTIPPDLLAKLIHIDYDRDMTFIALSAGEDGKPEALGVVDALAAPDRTEAEYSIMLRSDLKGTGLGKIMMEKIIAYCRSQKFGKVVGMVLRNNQPMRGLCTRLGFSCRADPDDDMVTMTLPLMTS